MQSILTQHLRGKSENNKTTPKRRTTVIRCGYKLQCAVVDAWCASAASLLHIDLLHESSSGGDDTDNENEDDESESGSMREIGRRVENVKPLITEPQRRALLCEVAAVSSVISTTQKGSLLIHKCIHAMMSIDTKVATGGGVTAHSEDNDSDDDDDDDDDDDKDGGQEESLLLGVKCLRDIITAPALPTDVFLPKGRARSQWCAHYVRHVAQYAIRLVCSDVTVASSTGSINTTTTGSSNDTATTPTTAAAAAAGLHGCGRILCAVQEAYEWVASTMHARPQLFIDQGGGGDARQFVIQLALSILPIARHASTVLVSATATASLKPPSKKTANARQQTDTTTAVRKLIRQVSTFVLRVAEEATAATTSSSSIGEFDDSITADVAATMAPLSLALLVDASTLPATTSNSSIASSSLDATSSGINNFWSAMEMVQMQLGRHEAAAHTRWRRSRALP